VETHTHKFLCEPKRAGELNDPDVRAKAEAASIWCQHASAHARESGGKAWTYLLIAHDQIAAQMTLAGCAARYTYQPTTA
jgi:type III restriction enzyme